MASEQIPLAKVSDVPEGGCIKVKGPKGLDIALFNIKGQIYALDDECPHEGGPLHEGEFEGATVTCPWHCWQFDVTTGECFNMPGIDAHKINITINEGTIYLI
jgi:nitrite reductase/ring-hydroxylating ferredoxin subunit